MELDDLLKKAAHAAIDACHKALRKMGWDDEKLARHDAEIMRTLKAESCKVVRQASEDFVAAFRAGQKAVPVFLVPFVAVGVQVASKIDRSTKPKRWRRPVTG